MFGQLCAVASDCTSVRAASRVVEQPDIAGSSAVVERANLQRGALAACVGREHKGGVRGERRAARHLVWNWILTSSHDEPEMLSRISPPPLVYELDADAA